MKTKTLMFAMAATLGLAGCADAPYNDDRPFGASVRNMVVGQIHDPQAAANPPAMAPTGLDGPAAVQVMKTYRKPPPEPTKASIPVQMSISQ